MDIKTLEKECEYKPYVLYCKKWGGVVKYTKRYDNPTTLLKCIHYLEKKGYTYTIFQEE